MHKQQAKQLARGGARVDTCSRCKKPANGSSAAKGGAAAVQRHRGAARARSRRSAVQRGAGRGRGVCGSRRLTARTAPAGGPAKSVGVLWVRVQRGRRRRLRPAAGGRHGHKNIAAKLVPARLGRPGHPGRCYRACLCLGRARVPAAGRELG